MPKFFQNVIMLHGWICLARSVKKSCYTKLRINRDLLFLEMMDVAWQLSMVPHIVKSLSRCNDARADMMRHSRCHKCCRDDVECVLDMDNLNMGHWQESLLPSGDLVDGALFYCPTNHHVICVRCIRENWWSFKFRNQHLCGCHHPHQPWTLTTAIVAGVPLSNLLKLWSTPYQGHVPSVQQQQEQQHRCASQEMCVPLKRIICPYSLDKLRTPSRERCWCFCCCLLAECGFIDKTPCIQRAAPTPIPPRLPAPGSGFAHIPSLKNLCLHSLSTLDIARVHKLALFPGT